MPKEFSWGNFNKHRTKGLSNWTAPCAAAYKVYSKSPLKLYWAYIYKRMAKTVPDIACRLIPCAV